MATIDQVLWPDDVPFSGVSIANFEAGSVSDTLTMRIYNERGNPGAGTIISNCFFAVGVGAIQDPSTIVFSGLAPLDQLWVEVRFVDSSSNIEAFVTDWTRLGTSTVLPFSQMVADSWRELEIRIRTPSYAQSFPYTFYFLVYIDEKVVGLVGPSVDWSRGIISGYGDPRQSMLLAGGEVTASLIPDDQIQVLRGFMIWRGDYVGFIEEAIIVTNQDGASEPLDIGESYIMMLSRNPDGTIDIVKGLRGTDPVSPSKPVDKLFFSYVTVDYTGGTPVIGQEDIFITPFWGHYYMRHEGGLNTTIHGGNYVSSGAWKFSVDPEPLLLTALSDNYVWIRGDGTLSVIVGDSSLPDSNSDLLYKGVTDASTVVSIDDYREFYGAVSVLSLSGNCPVSVGVVDEILYLDTRLILYKVVVQLDTNPGVGSDTIFDLKVDGVSIYPNPAMVDTRPTFLPGATNAVDNSNHHVIGVLPKGSAISIESVQYSGGTQPGFVKVFLYCQ